MSIKKYSFKKQGNKKLSAHFAVSEFASHVSGKLTTDDVLVDSGFIKKLEKFFDYGITSIAVTSGYRDAKCDKAVGGNGKGAHTKGIAADIICKRNGKTIHSKYVAALAQLIGRSGIGIISPMATHVDVRTTKNYVNGHWHGNESTGENYIKDFFAYSGFSRAELFGRLEYFSEKCYYIRATRKAPIHKTPSDTGAIKKYYEKGKRARVFAEKNGYCKVLSGWIKISHTEKD